MKLNELKQEMNSAMLEGSSSAAVMMETRIRPKIQNFMRHKSAKIAVNSLAAFLMLLRFSTVAFAASTGTADFEARVENASKDILGFLQGVILSIGAVSLAACGLVLLTGIGGQRASENAKSWMLRIALGMGIVLLAEPIIAWIASFFSGSTGSNP